MSVRVRSVGALAVVLASLVLSTGVAPSAPAPTEAATPSLAVWPRNDLVDDEPLRIVVRNWVTRFFLSAEVCRAGDDAYDVDSTCDYLGTFEPGPAGNARIQRPADVIVDGRHPVDCRVEACEVQVIDVNTGDSIGRRLLRVPLTFDPGGPDPTRPDTSATPTTDLVAGDEVTVTGNGFPLRPRKPTEADGPPDLAEGGDGPARPVYLYQCRASATSYFGCDQDTTVAGMTRTGHFTTTYEVRSRLFLHNGGTVDCRTEACAIVATSNDQHSEAGIVPLAFDPGGPAPPAPTVSITPSGPYQEGQDLTITGEDFAADAFVDLALCPPGAEGYSFYVCHHVWDFQMTDADGSVTFQHPAHSRINPDVGPEVDCRLVSCRFVIATTIDVEEAPGAPLTFDPGVPARSWALSATPHTGLRDGDVISASGSGYQPVERTVVRQCVVARVDLPRFLCGQQRTRVAVDPESPTSFTTNFVVRRQIYGTWGRVNCARRYCYLATDDGENGFVRGSRLVFRP